MDSSDFPTDDEGISLLPPHSIEAEMALLGSLMICDGDPLSFSTANAAVKKESFFAPDNQVIFGTLAEMQRAGLKIDAITVRDELKRQNIADEVGGQAYIGQLLNTVPSWTHIAEYARIVAEHYTRREMIRLGEWLRNRGYEPPVTGGPPADTLAEAARKVSALLTAGIGKASEKLDAVIVDVMEDLDLPTGTMMATTFPSLDRVVGGMEGGEMIIVAARPSMGKSLLLKQWLIQLARAGVPCGLVHLEESRRKIGRNMLAAAAGIENKRVRNRDLNPNEKMRIGAAASELASLPLHLSAARRLADIKAVVANWTAREGVKVVGIDYVQRIAGAPGKDRYQQTSAISLEISDLIKETGVVGLVVAQLNRGVESRDDKRPTMADLRDSGQLEQDADAIVFLHREDYYHLDDTAYQPTGVAELIIAKWRDSTRGGVIRLRSDLKTQRFVDDLPSSKIADPFGTPDQAASHYDSQF